MTIKTSNQLIHLTGEGEEWWTDSKGNMRAKFFDGNLQTVIVKTEGNSEDTVTL